MQGIICYSGNLFLLAVTTVLVILSLELTYSILPFGGVFLSIYVFVVLSLTIWFTWNYFQSLLKQNKPICYDFENNSCLKTAKYVYGYIRANLWSSDESYKSDCKAGDGLNAQSKLKNIDERIDDFVRDVESLFISRWYSQISADETFLSETRNLLDEIVRRFLQIVVQVDHKKLVHGCFKILLKHVKEYRKTVRRQQRNGGSVEDLYRYAHVGSKNGKAFNHFMCQITTKVFRQFINWELYNSVPCKCLTSILAKKLTTYLLVYFSNPAFINYKLAQACALKVTKAELVLDEYEAISLSDIDHSEIFTKESSEDDWPECKSKNTKLLNGSTDVSTTPKISPRKNDIKLTTRDGSPVQSKLLVDASDEFEPKVPPNRPKHEDSEVSNDTPVARVPSKPVKIYESKSVGRETWRNSSDLTCISLGEDLLVLEDMNDGSAQFEDLIEKRLWKDNSDSLEVDEKGEEIKDTTGSSPSPNIPAFLTNTMKPIGSVTASTLHNMKELQQSTVNNVSQVTSSAMHKIGDLQDEAAGVMEGILDFGRAGIRKGLRLTGLHDNIADHLKKDALKILDMEDRYQKKQEKRQDIIKQPEKPHKASKLIKIPHISSEEIKSELQSLDENIWLNPLMKESPNFDGQLLLEKSPIISPQPAANFGVVPNISTEGVSESPDLEYEDTTDLATTTAKLRSLLQQKSSESTLTTPALSPMPPEAGSIEDIIEVDRALPSLYKFCARTATGVFQNTLNTIKTALPGNISDQEHSDELFNQQSSIDNWTFVASDTGPEDLMVHVERLLNERRVFCTLDNAYEAIETLDMLDHEDVIWDTTPIRNYYDELDDFDVHIPITKALVDIFCELVGDTETLLIQESVVKIFLIYCGTLSEEYVNTTSSKLIRNINTLIGKLPNTSNKQPKAMKLSQLSAVVLEILPGYVKKMIGQNNLDCAASTFISCFQSHRINQDVALQLFELIALLIIDASSKMSPTYSA